MNVAFLQEHLWQAATPVSPTSCSYSLGPSRSHAPVHSADSTQSVTLTPLLLKPLLACPIVLPLQSSGKTQSWANPTICFLGSYTQVSKCKWSKSIQLCGLVFMDSNRRWACPALSLTPLQGQFLKKVVCFLLIIHHSSPHSSIHCNWISPPLSTSFPKVHNHQNAT